MSDQGGRYAQPVEDGRSAFLYAQGRLPLPVHPQSIAQEPNDPSVELNLHTVQKNFQANRDDDFESKICRLKTDLKEAEEGWEEFFFKLSQDMPALELLDCEPGTPLAEGAFGKVMLKRNPQNKKWIVEKEVLKNRYMYYVEEVIVPLGFSSPHLISILGARYYKDTIKLYMPFAGFSLEWWFGKIPREKIRGIAMQGFSAIDCLSDNKIMHLDIKPQNVCLSPSMHLTVIDFGSCQKVTPTLPKIRGWTTAYMSAEQIRYSVGLNSGEKLDCGISTQSDVYSFAMTIISVWYGVHWPYLHPSTGKSGFDLKAFLDKYPTFARIFLSKITDPKLKLVLDMALCVDPSERITPKQALEILSGEEFSAGRSHGSAQLDEIPGPSELTRRPPEVIVIDSGISEASTEPNVCVEEPMCDPNTQQLMDSGESTPPEKKRRLSEEAMDYEILEPDPEQQLSMRSGNVPKLPIFD